MHKHTLDLDSLVVSTFATQGAQNSLAVDEMALSLSCYCTLLTQTTSDVK